MTISYCFCCCPCHHMVHVLGFPLSALSPAAILIIAHCRRLTRSDSKLWEHNLCLSSKYQFALKLEIKKIRKYKIGTVRLFLMFKLSKGSLGLDAFKMLKHMAQRKSEWQLAIPCLRTKSILTAGCFQGIRPADLCSYRLRDLCCGREQEL